ncbi:cytochrome P450 1A5-like isoform X2 [Varanus komodoensis]|uniref:cytochrome P450 1A5-like isoform X2 n=1 Tax=Varanus komodoensis TaxID=61221 RepID=UPI001CF7E852|nr:cytochrome P450 1A5-like isoform X2 [Varanus komodoensis]
MSLVGILSTLLATEALVAFAIFCLIFMIVRSFWDPIPQGQKRVPGPRNYPLIGNILELGKDPHLSLTRLSQEYGEVLKIHIGTKPVLVLSGLETIRQALVRQGGDFLGRPDLYSFRYVIDGQSLTFGNDTGEVWQARRKLAQNALKSFSVSASPTCSSTCLLEEHILHEAEYLLGKLQEVMHEKKRFDPYPYLVTSVANVVCAMCFGKRYSHDNQEFLSLVNESEKFVEVAFSGNPADFIPVLQYLPRYSMKAFKDFNQRFNAFLVNRVQEHYKTFSKDSIRDITDSLIDQSQGNKIDQNGKLRLPPEKIVNLVNDIFGADEIIGRERKPQLSDRPSLPYTEAFILEMFRHSSFIPFTIPHCTTRDTVLNGFHIPKGLCVFINQWQVNHDANLWKDPFSFNPERFLTADGKDINKDEREKVLTFGLGKRRCIGETIARWEIFLFLTILLQQLQFSVQDGVKVDMTPRYGLSMKHKRCDQIRVEHRFPKTISE